MAVADLVSTLPAFSQNDYTTYDEVITVPEYSVVKHPGSLSFTEAASIWMMFLTAYGALIADSNVTKGDFVVIFEASSSVVLAAIQTANFAGAASIAVTRTPANKKKLLEAGATQVITTEEVDVGQEVMRITNEKGARVAFDPIGGPNFPKLISALAEQAIVNIYGALGDGITPILILDKETKDKSYDKST